MAIVTVWVWDSEERQKPMSWRRDGVIRYQADPERAGPAALVLPQYSAVSPKHLQGFMQGGVNFPDIQHNNVQV